MVEIDLTEHRASLAYLSTRAGRLAYLDLGPRDGEPVLLVHGMPTSSYLYRHVARRLAGHGLRVIAPDLLGFGASDKPTDASEYALDRQAARLTGLLDHLGLTTATFVAHDLGGPWVFEVADRQSHRVDRLVLLNTSAYAELMTPPREARLVGSPVGPLMLALMASRPGRRMIGTFFTDFTARDTTVSRQAIAAYWTSLREGGTRAFRVFAQDLDAGMAQFSRYAAALRRLQPPTAIIWGAEDPVLRADKLVPRFAADLRIPDHRVHVLDRASHFLQEDRPYDVADLVAAFVHDSSQATPSGTNEATRPSR